MANKEQYLDRNGVSHFYLLIKNKLTTYFKTLFVSKKDGYDLSQNDFTNELKTKLENMSNGGGGTGSVEGAVLYTEQTLTKEQKTQARENIGASDFDGEWNNLKNKPFGIVGYNYEWDGNTLDKETFSLVDSITFCKISSNILTEDDIIGATVNYYFDGDTTEDVVNQGEALALVKTDAGNLFVVAYGQFPVVIVATTTEEDNFGGMSFSMPTEGIWFIHFVGEKEYTRYIQKVSSIKTIDEYYLPETVVKVDDNGLVPSSQLPSYVDDVVEGYYNSEDNLFYTGSDYSSSITGESGKIYLDLNTNSSYRYGGSIFVKIESSAGLVALTNTEIDEIIASVDSSTE